jgi:hypothetical protein
MTVLPPNQGGGGGGGVSGNNGSNAGKLFAAGQAIQGPRSSGLRPSGTEGELHAARLHLMVHEAHHCTCVLLQVVRCGQGGLAA